MNDALTLATAVGCGLAGGVFFAFSTFVMRALADLPPAQGAAAMQAVNRRAISPLFMLALFGTAAACVAAVAWAAVSWEGRAGWVVAGAGVYLAGVILVTIVRNVPLNDRLAAVDPDGAEAAAVWETYLRAWTAWNHVRTVSGLAAAALLTVAIAVE